MSQPMKPCYFVIGYPSHLGGADTELWHMLRAVRPAGIDVSLIPTWHAAPEWRLRCDEIGVRTIEVGGRGGFSQVDGLAGATVLSFCNGEFLANADVFCELDCRIVWVGCMTWMFPAEREHYDRHGPFDAYVFQSEFQRSKLYPGLQRYGVREQQCFLIRGAFDAGEFPFTPRPHEPDTDFVIGRLARPDLDKWSSNTWPIYGAVPYARRRARLMGWNDRLAHKLGKPPEWAEVLPPCAESSRDFMQKLHCLMAINGGAQENWPRIGLEAMSTGVPVIAENQWGWREMVVHGETGFLANNDQEYAYYAGYLAMNEDARQKIIKNARERLVEELAKPEVIRSQWQQVFDYVESLPRRDKANDHNRTNATEPASITGGNGHAERPAMPPELALAANEAWNSVATSDLATMTLRDAFIRGFVARDRASQANNEAAVPKAMTQANAE